MSKKKGAQLKKSVVATENCVIEAIRGYKREGRREFYQVKWKGFRESQNTWEPLKNLTEAKQLIKKFREDQESKEREEKGKPRRGPGRKAKGNKKKNIPSKDPSVITILSSNNIESNAEEEEKVDAQDLEENEENHYQHQPIHEVNKNKEEEVDERPDPKRGVVSDSEPNNLPEPAVPSREPTSEEAESESQPSHRIRQYPTKQVQVPETRVLKVRRLVVMDSDIFYEVELSNIASDPDIELLPGTLVLAQNPGALADFFNREVKAMMISVKTA